MGSASSLITKVAGTALMLIGMLYTGQCAHLLYLYLFTGTLFIIMLPYWMLVLHIAAGTWAFMMGMQLYRSKRTTRSSYLSALAAYAAA